MGALARAVTGAKGYRQRPRGPFHALRRKGKQLVDQMVLAAQRWVNATYAGVSGYVAVEETGRTGWSTMYSLIRALQHELGIITLSNSFGLAH